MFFPHIKNAAKSIHHVSIVQEKYVWNLIYYEIIQFYFAQLHI